MSHDRKWGRLPRVGRADVKTDVHDEVESHLAMQAADLEREGWSASAARAEARRLFGQRGSFEREMLAISARREREARRAQWLEELWQDVRYALRLVKRTPLFSAVIVLTLAIGIGANTAVFSAVDAALLRPLPYGAADRLVSVWSRYVPESGYDFEWMSLSAPELRDYRNTARAVSAVAGYTTGETNILVGDGAADRVSVGYGTANMFDVLDVRASLGRTFLPGDDAPGANCRVVLSYGLWLERFGGTADAVSQTLRIEGQPCDVIGVMPARFFFPDKSVRLWRPLGIEANAQLAEDRRSHWLAAVARLAPYTDLAQAKAELDPMMSAWRSVDDHHKGHGIVVRPFREEIVGSQRAVLILLLSAAGLVLLIICANLATLLLTRAEGRRREVAVRAALGAGQWRIARQFLAENTVLTLLGGVCALGIAWLLIRALAGAATLPQVEELALNGRVLAFAALVSVVTGALLGLLPSLQARTLRLQEILRMQGRNASAPGSAIRVRHTLVVLEIAISVAVVSAAALLVRSYDQLRRADIGVAGRETALMDVTLSATDYPEASRITAFFRELRAEVAALPGVRSVGLVSNFPLRSTPGMDSFRIDGRPEPQPGAPSYNGGYVMATPGYFEAAGIPLLRGRLLEDGDVRGAPFVAVIDELAAREYWPGTDPIGHRIRYYGADSAWITIVGVVGTVRYMSPQQEPRPAVYVAHAQAPRGGFYSGHSMTLVVRSTNSLDHAEPVREIVHRLDRHVPVTNVASIDDVVSDATEQPRFATTLMSLFALVSLLVGALGVYGVLSYHVRARTQEIGIRMALGASASSVRAMVLRQGMLLAAAGISIGAALSLASRRLLTGMLYGVDAGDPVTFVAVACVLAGVSGIASYMPARRATQVDPAAAFRAG